MTNICFFILALFLAPLFPGLINQTKAVFAGRKGSGIFRLYYDIYKLLLKSSPRSTTTTWLFDIAPAVSLSATTIACALFFLAPILPALNFTASAILFFYLLASSRFMTLLSAYDTGSAFCGMGASREAQFSTFLEPILLIVLGFLILLTNSTSLFEMTNGFPVASWSLHPVALLLIAVSFFILLLSECARVPFDDPETHLELTMIHEAMILDQSGSDLAFTHYSASLKFELLAIFLVSILLPEFSLPVLTDSSFPPCCIAHAEKLRLAAAQTLRVAALFIGAFVIAIFTGIVESVIARMRFLKTPQVLLAANIFAILAVLIFLMF